MTQPVKSLGLDGENSIGKTTRRTGARASIGRRFRNPTPRSVATMEFFYPANRFINFYVVRVDHRAARA